MHILKGVGKVQFHYDFANGAVTSVGDSTKILGGSNPWPLLHLLFPSTPFAFLFPPFFSLLDSVISRPLKYS